MLTRNLTRPTNRASQARRRSRRPGLGGGARGRGTRSLQGATHAPAPRWSPAAEGMRTRAAWSHAPSPHPPAPAGATSPHFSDEMVDLAGLMSSAVAIVDIDHRNARRARIEHREQRRDPTERRALPDAGWHGDAR